MIPLLGSLYSLFTALLHCASSFVPEAFNFQSPLANLNDTGFSSVLQFSSLLFLTVLVASATDPLVPAVRHPWRRERSPKGTES